MKKVREKEIYKGMTKNRKEQRHGFLSYNKKKK